MATEASPTPQRAAVPFPTMDYNSTIEYYKHMMSQNTVSPSVQQQHDTGAMTDADYQTYLNGLRQANESYEYAIKQLESSANYLKDYSKYLNSTTPPAANAPSTSNNNNGGGGSTTINVAGSKSSGMSTASIIGIVLGVVATVALLAGVFIFYKRRPTVRQPAAYSKDDDDDKTLDDMTHGTTAYTGASLKSPMFTSQELGVDEELIAVRVPLDKIERGPLIARGGFGEVYRGMFRGQPVAIKSLLSHKRKDVAMIKLFMAEIKFMSTIDHPRVVQFLGVAWESLSDLCVLTEFMNGGDLYTTLSNWDSAEPPRSRGFDPDKVKIGLHVAHALTYMHSLQPVVLHRDLKSRNILLDRQLNAKLTDFGIAREQIDKTMTAGVGSSLWMAPEVMMGQRYNEKADVFSFGVVLSELDTQQLPYSDALEDGTGRQLPQTAILQLVSMGRITIQLSDRAHSRFPELYDLARECVSMDPHARPSAAETLHRLNSVWKRVGDPHGFF